MKGKLCICCGSGGHCCDPAQYLYPVNFFENAALLHSCGWIKTEVFKNDYNMVLYTSKKIMSMLPSKMVPFSDCMDFLGGSG